MAPNNLFLLELMVGNGYRNFTNVAKYPPVINPQNRCKGADLIGKVKYGAQQSFVQLVP